jgi:hypothetical protein
MQLPSLHENAWKHSKYMYEQLLTMLDSNSKHPASHGAHRRVQVLGKVASHVAVRWPFECMYTYLSATYNSASSQQTPPITANTAAPRSSTLTCQALAAASAPPSLAVHQQQNQPCPGTPPAPLLRSAQTLEWAGPECGLGLTG